METELIVNTPDEFDIVPKERNVKINFVCLHCGKKSSFRYRKDRHENQRRLLCSSCSMIDTNIKKYGSKYSAQNQEIKEKIRNTVISEKGIDCNPEIWVKDQEDFINTKKKSKTIIHFNCSKCGKESQFLYKKYDFDRQKRLLCTSCSRKDKTFNTKDIFEPDEIDNTLKPGTILNCHCSNCNRPYKVSFRVDRVDNFKRLVCPTCQRKLSTLQKYGVPHYAQTDESRHNRKSMYVYDNEQFDSSWELALWIFSKDNNIEIIHEPTKFTYEFNGVLHTYYPDFLFDGKLIEIKGKQFFKPDGTMCNPYDPSQDGLFEAKHQCMLKNNVIIYGQNEIRPILDWVNNKYTNAYLGLFKKDLPFPYMNETFTNKSDFGIIQHFHKSIYLASRQGKLSPITAWKNKDLIKMSALNRLKYVGKCEPLDIIQGFNIVKIAPKVSVFKPKKAEGLINKYLIESTNIVDPFSGFSGRMLASYNLGKKYLGFDINEMHVKESNEIIDYKNISDFCTVCVEDIIKSPVRHLDNYSLFTCPPYGGKEHWSENNDEVEKTCDEWIDICMDKYKCKSYLFVVDKTDKYKDFVVDKIINKSHLGVNTELVIFIRTN